MAITLVNLGGSAADTVGANRIVTLPAALQANDIVLVLLATGVSAVTPPAGYTLIGTTVNNINSFMNVYWHLVASSAESSTTVTFTFASALRRYCCLAYRGCDPVTPINANAKKETNTGSASTVTNAAITPTVDNGLLVLFGNGFGGTSLTLTGTPTTTSRFNVASFSLLSDVAAPGSGTAVADGTYTLTESSATTMGILAVILAPVPTPGGAQPELFRRSFSNIQKIAYIRNLLAKPPIP